MIKRFMLMGAAVLGLAACANELPPEQKAVQRANWIKIANAAVPQCVAAVENRPRNYSVLKELGYKHTIPPLSGRTDHFDAPERTALNMRAASYSFTPKLGCTADYKFEQDSIADLVNIWLAAFKTNGYHVQQIGTGTYQASANGKSFTMYATRTMTASYTDPGSTIEIRGR